MSSGSDAVKRLVIFASGSGSNAEALIRYFKNNEHVQVAAVFVNKPEAAVIHKARALGVDVILFTREEWKHGDVLNRLRAVQTDYILLAGFYWLLPAAIVDAYENRILNIHPSLLPKYGGKGMYGLHVHESVLQAGEKESGITIHLVNKEYDSGKVLFQKAVPVLEDDTSMTLAARVNALELEYYGPVAARYIMS